MLYSAGAQCNATKKNSNYNGKIEYTTTLGVKLLDGVCITLKHFVNERAALEGIGFFWNNGARIAALYELHFYIAGAPGLKWYVGPGVHVGFYNTSYWNKNGDRSFAGVACLLGLDYKIKNAPLNLSLDWQPSFEFGEDWGYTVLLFDLPFYLTKQHINCSKQGQY